MPVSFRLEGLTLTVEDVEKSVAFYRDLIGLTVTYKLFPAFALLNHGGVSIGLLSLPEAAKEGVTAMSAAQKRGVHVEFTTDNLDALYAELKAKDVVFIDEPHDEPWERLFTALDPDGYAVEFAQGIRGKNQIA